MKNKTNGLKVMLCKHILSALKDVVGVVLAGVMFLTLSGCIAPGPEIVRKPYVVVVLFDMSGSISKETRTTYKEIFSEKILKPDDKKYDIKVPVNPKGIDAGDAIYVSEINTNSDTAAPWIDEKLLKPTLADPLLGNTGIDIKDGEKNKEEVEKIKAKIRDKVAAKLEEVGKNGTPLTSIIASTRNAATIFKSEEYKGYDRLLVLFTDGIEESRTANFNRGTPLTPKESDQIIDDLKEKEMLPDLQGVQVYVFGANGGKGSGDNSENYHEVKKFWVDYFKAANAKVVSYGPALKDFPPPQSQKPGTAP